MTPIWQVCHSSLCLRKVFIYIGLFRLMRCYYCNRACRNKQALRAHLRFCPNREVKEKNRERKSIFELSEAARERGERKRERLMERREEIRDIVVIELNKLKRGMKPEMYTTRSELPARVRTPAAEPETETESAPETETEYDRMEKMLDDADRRERNKAWIDAEIVKVRAERKKWEDELAKYNGV